MVSRSRKTVIIALITLVGFGAGAYGFKTYKDKKKKTPADESAGVAEVTKGDIEVRFMDAGEISPKHFVDIASKVSGRVIEMAVDEGRRVKKGDTLAVIQPGRTEAEQYVPVPVASPIDGVVMRFQKRGGYQEEPTLARLGNYVTGLMDSTQPTYLMTVADVSRLVVKMKISEMDILKLKEGMSVTVKIDALPAESYPGKVTLVSPQAEKDQNNLKNFKVEVTLLKPDGRLKPGMTARVDGLLESRTGVLKVPISAVFEEGRKTIAYVAPADKKKGKPQKVDIKLGLRNEMDAEVLSGLKEGQKLLTDKPAEKEG